MSIVYKKIEDKNKKTILGITERLRRSKRKEKAYISLLAADTLMHYLREQEIEAGNKNCYSSHPGLLNDFDIADIRAGNAKIDVRVIEEDEHPQMRIPKSHSEYGFTPDIYVGMKINVESNDSEIIGFIEANQLVGLPEDKNYIFVDISNLKPVSEIKQVIESIEPAQIFFSQEDHEKTQGLYLSYLDYEISHEDQAFFIKHLAACDSCRNEFYTFYDLDKKIWLVDNIKELINLKDSSDIVKDSIEDEDDYYIDVENLASENLSATGHDNLDIIFEKTDTLNENFGEISSEFDEIEEDESGEVLEIVDDEDEEEEASLRSLIEHNRQKIASPEQLIEEKFKLADLPQENFIEKEEEISLDEIDRSSAAEPVNEFLEESENFDEFQESDEENEIQQILKDKIKALKESGWYQSEDSEKYAARINSEIAKEEVLESNLSEEPSQEPEIPISSENDEEAEDTKISNVVENSVLSDYLDSLSKEKSDRLNAEEAEFESAQKDKASSVVKNPQKSSSAINKVVAASAAGIILSGLAYYGYTQLINNNKNLPKIMSQANISQPAIQNNLTQPLTNSQKNPVQNEVLTPKTSQTGDKEQEKIPEVTNLNDLAENAKAKNADALAKAFTKDGPAKISNISWEIAASLANDPSLHDYLMVTGQALKMTLIKNFTAITDRALNDQIKIKLKLDLTGNIMESAIKESSGSSQIDDAALQSVKETLNYTKLPKINTDKKYIKTNVIISL